MIRSFLITLGLCLIAVTSAAQSNPTYSTAELCKILRPCLAPAKYRAGPFLAKPVIRSVTLRQVQSICGGPFAIKRSREVTLHAVMSGDGALGCATFANGSCLVHVPSDLQNVLPDLYRLVLAHELAHCRGWIHEQF